MGTQPKEEDDDGSGSQAPRTSQLPPPTQLERPAECVNRNSTPAFAILCSVMDRLRNEKAGKRSETLARFFEIWRKKVGYDLYPLIRLLLPDVSCD
jgi:DNA ligase-4